MNQFQLFGGTVVAGMAAMAAITLAQAPASQPARPVFVDGQAQIVPAFQDATQWIRQTLWVETEFDSDGDGKRDRMFVDVTRPQQTETEGLKVPVIYESSPYFAGTSGPREFLWDVKQEVGATPPPRTSQPPIAFKPTRPNVSNSQVNTWVPRGFAVVHSEAPGTGLSQGCPTVGGAPEELAPKAVIDWLNGRAKGFTTIDGTEEVVATRWSTGKVGHDRHVVQRHASRGRGDHRGAGARGDHSDRAEYVLLPLLPEQRSRSSPGRMARRGHRLPLRLRPQRRSRAARGAATRGIGTASSRADATARAGDYNAFWAERDLLKKVEQDQGRGADGARLQRLERGAGAQRSDRDGAERAECRCRCTSTRAATAGAPPLEMMNRWFTRYLYGVQNGVEKDPKAWIVRETAPVPAAAADAPAAQPPATPAAAAGQGRGRTATPPPTPYADYPNPAASLVTLHLAAGGGARGGLRLEAAGTQGTETLIDNVEFSGAALAKAEQSPNRLLYATAELAAPLHISGTASITLRLASSKPAANLSVWLVTLPWTDGPIGPANLITRGWADPQNYASLKRGGDYHSTSPGTAAHAGPVLHA